MNVFEELEDNSFINDMLKKTSGRPFNKSDGYDVKVHGFYTRTEPRDEWIENSSTYSSRNVEPTEDGGEVRENPYGMPEEVMGWNDILQEAFCIHAVDYREAGLDWEEAERLAIEDVKKSPDFSIYFRG
ncbi:MAG: hypothetical protein ACLPVO_00465 [Desulfomonilaceae bacterium]